MQIAIKSGIDVRGINPPMSGEQYVMFGANM